MLDPIARTWLRAIARGAPIGGIVLLSAGCWSTGGDCAPRRDVSFAITAEQAAGAMLAASDAGVGSDGGSAPSCELLCQRHESLRALEEVRACSVVSGEAGFAIECTTQIFCVGGRQPAGLLAARGGPTASPVGAWLAASAHLERASVPAFEELADELVLHGLPRALSSEARRSARDEIAHADEIDRLARRAGAAPRPVRRAPTEPRSLAEVAIDNAIEGCVREAYAALVATHQQHAARDPEVRQAYARIARDEARHALFSLALHDTLSPRLSPRGRRGVESAREQAVAALARAVAGEEPHALRAELGLPDAERAVALAESLAPRVRARAPSFGL